MYGLGRIYKGFTDSLSLFHLLGFLSSELRAGDSADPGGNCGSHEAGGGARGGASPAHQYPLHSGSGPAAEPAPPILQEALGPASAA